MRRLLAISALALVIFAACGPEEKAPVQEDYFTVTEPDGPAGAEAGTVTVAISTNLQFEVSIPEADDWLSVGSKGTDAVVFSLETNMEDSMRESLVSFLSDGKVVGELGIVQKAGQGIEFNFEPVEALDADAAAFDVMISSNVDYELRETAPQTWISASPVAGGVHVEVEANPSEEARRADLEFFRTGKDSKIGVISIVQNGIVYQVKLNGVPVASLEDALAALPAMSEAATIELGPESFDLHIAIGGDVTVPVTIQGAGEKTIIASVEVMKASVSLKDLTLKPSGEFLPVLDPNVASGYNHPFGLFVHRAAYGVSLERVTVDMSEAAANTTGMFWLGGDGERGTRRDLLQDCVLRGRAGERNAQLYGAVIDIIGNTIISGHSAYGIRIGGSGGNYLLHNNKFESASSDAAFGVQFYSLSNSSVTFGDGEGDTNSQDGTFRAVFGANENIASGHGNSFNPRISYNDGVISLATKALTRIWGKYTISLPWDSAVSSIAEWDRNAAVTEDYIYVPIAGRATADYGVAVFDRATGDFYHKLTAGIDAQAGLFPTCGAASVKDGAATIALICNMVNTAGGHLKVYAYRSPDAAPETVIDYELPEALRYGDKMSVYGDWNSGYIFFTPYGDPADHRRQMLMFPVNGGVVASQPLVKNLNVDAPSATGNENHMNGFYMYNSIEGLYAGTQRPSLYNRWEANDANGFDQTGDSDWQMVYQRRVFESSILDPQFFKIGEQEYMAYASYIPSGRFTSDGKAIATGYLRVVRLPADYDNAGYSHLKVKMYKIMDDNNLSEVSEVYALGDAVNTAAGGTIATNGTGYCSVIEIDGQTFVLAGITGAGMSLFRFNE